MSSRLPPSLRDPEYLGQRVTRTVRQLAGGSAGTKIASASPSDPSRLLARIRGSAHPSTIFSTLAARRFQRDRFPATGTLSGTIPTTFTLSQTPISGSLHVYLNGLEADEGTDYTLSGNVITALTPLAQAAGDVLDARYAYNSTPAGTATSGSGPVVIVPYSSSGWKYLIPAYSDATDYSSPSFNDSAWSTGTLPAGHASGTSYTGFGIPWGTSTTQAKIWVRRQIPAGNTFTVKVLVDDNASVYWNGTLIQNLTIGTTAVTIPSTAVTSGVQTLAIVATDTVNPAANLDVQVEGILT